MCSKLGNDTYLVALPSPARALPPRTRARAFAQCRARACAPTPVRSQSVEPTRLALRRVRRLPLQPTPAPRPAPCTSAPALAHACTSPCAARVGSRSSPHLRLALRRASFTLGPRVGSRSSPRLRLALRRVVPRARVLNLCLDWLVHGHGLDGLNWKIRGKLVLSQSFSFFYFRKSS
jgi:hypothetical protein